MKKRGFSIESYAFDGLQKKTSMVCHDVDGLMKMFPHPSVMKNLLLGFPCLGSA